MVSPGLGSTASPSCRDCPSQGFSGGTGEGQSRPSIADPLSRYSILPQTNRYRSFLVREIELWKGQARCAFPGRITSFGLLTCLALAPCLLSRYSLKWNMVPYFIRLFPSACVAFYRLLSLPTPRALSRIGSESSHCRARALRITLSRQRRLSEPSRALSSGRVRERADGKRRRKTRSAKKNE